MGIFALASSFCHNDWQDCFTCRQWKPFEDQAEGDDAAMIKEHKTQGTMDQQRHHCFTIFFKNLILWVLQQIPDSSSISPHLSFLHISWMYTEIANFMRGSSVQCSSDIVQFWKGCILLPTGCTLNPVLYWAALSSFWDGTLDTWEMHLHTRDQEQPAAAWSDECRHIMPVLSLLFPELGGSLGVGVASLSSQKASSSSSTST